jgi:hydroxyacylglutathione hydrolase
MRLQRFEVPGLAHYSYILIAGGQGLVVDPKRDVDTYIDYAAAHNLRISHIVETHIHADYCSGAVELGSRTGAELWLSAHDKGEDFQYQFAHHDFTDREEIRFGDLRVQALHTPGHTPEHLSFLVYDTGRSSEPMAMMSGDFLFVGSVGRPDLLGEAAKQRLAEELYDSLHQRTARLPDFVEVHPAHGAGSLCGAGMGERQQTTLGYERVANMFFADKDKNGFVRHILGSVPPFPEYYKRMKQVNGQGPRVLGGIPGSNAMSVREFKESLEQDDAVVIDLRRPEAFGGAHIPGSYNIGAGQNLSMWAAWVVPYDRAILLAGDEGTNYEDARRSLMRVGLDEVRGYLNGGVKAWIEAGLPQSHLPQMSVEELHRKASTDIVDVRSNGEWNSGHIERARHIPAGEVPHRLGELPRNGTIHVICGTGYRSSIAASILKREGFKDVVNVVGGMTAWNRAKLPTTIDDRQKTCVA